MAATAKDIADRVGLSRPSVSRILNDTQGFRVSPETRRRVLEMAAEMNYRPNAIARSLRQQSTDIIGFYSGYKHLDTLDPFNAEIVHGLQKGSEAACKDLLMHGNVRGRSADDIHRELLNGKIDGLILLSEPNDPLVTLLSKSSLPVVAVADAIPTLPSVVADDAAGSRMIVQYLAGKGHRRVLYRKSPLGTASDVRRLSAFCDEASLAGITVVDTVEHFWTEGLNDRETAWLLGPDDERPTALVGWNDMVTYQALKACLNMGLRVPDDIAFVGFDGFRWPQEPAHPLTTIRAHWSDVVRKAVDLLAARLNGEEIPMETVMPVELIIGNTA